MGISGTSPMSEREEIAALKARIAILEEQLRLAAVKQFAPKSEKLSTLAQFDLFNEAESARRQAGQRDARRAEIAVPAHTRERGKRKPIDATLPRVRIEHDIPDDQKICPCGCQLTRIGEVTSEQFDLIPARAQVLAARALQVCLPHLRRHEPRRACRGDGRDAGAADPEEQRIARSRRIHHGVEVRRRPAALSPGRHSRALSHRAVAHDHGRLDDQARRSRDAADQPDARDAARLRHPADGRDERAGAERRRSPCAGEILHVGATRWGTGTTHHPVRLRGLARRRDPDATARRVQGLSAIRRLCWLRRSGPSRRRHPRRLPRSCAPQVRRSGEGPARRCWPGARPCAASLADPAQDLRDREDRARGEDVPGTAASHCARRKRDRSGTSCVRGSIETSARHRRKRYTGKAINYLAANGRSSSAISTMAASK